MPEDSFYKVIGISLALTSGLFIGSSFIFKKKGLIESRKKHGEIGEGHSYLSSPLWWTGMILMTLGEVANFGAYAFVPAILVTPLGALSVVVSAILSSVFLNERLNFSGKVGCAQCLIGATLIVIHAPETNASDTIPQFVSYVITPSFLVYCFICLFSVLYLIYYVSPRYGDKNPIVYIAICSTVGSFLVLSTQGFGSAIVYSAKNWNTDNQFLHWQIYPLLGFIVFTVLTQIHFLNKALNQFSTAIVTPVYYVFFTTMTMISSAVLFRGFDVTNAASGLSLIFGFLVIVGGVSLLFQYSTKVIRHNALHKARKAARREPVDIDDELAGIGSDDDDDMALSENQGEEVSLPKWKLKEHTEPGRPKVLATRYVAEQNIQIESDNDASSIESSAPPSHHSSEVSLRINTHEEAQRRLRQVSREPNTYLYPPSSSANGQSPGAASPIRFQLEQHRNISQPRLKPTTPSTFPATALQNSPRLTPIQQAKSHHSNNGVINAGQKNKGDFSPLPTNAVPKDGVASTRGRGNDTSQGEDDGPPFGDTGSGAEESPAGSMTDLMEGTKKPGNAAKKGRVAGFK